MKFKAGDTCYRVNSNTALLVHQQDGVELFKATVVEKDDGLYAVMTNLLYFVGKNTYVNSGSGFDPIGAGIRYSIQDNCLEKLSDAKREMISEIFLKKTWL